VKQEWGVQAEEGFVLWLDGRKIDELEGVGEEEELESKIDSLIYQAHPRECDDFSPSFQLMHALESSC